MSDIIAKRISEDVYEKLSTEERAIIRYLATNLVITVKAATGVTQRSAPTADKLLNGLVQQGLLDPLKKDGAIVKLPKQFCLKGR